MYDTLITENRKNHLCMSSPWWIVLAKCY